MYNVPCAKFSTRRTPKMRESPEAIRKRNMAAVRPLRLWAKTNDGSGIGRPPSPYPLPLDGGEGYDGRGQGEREGQLVHELGRVDVHRGLHDGEGVLRVLHRLAVDLSPVRLMILLADRQLAVRHIDREAQQRLGHLVGVGAAR